MESTLKEIEKTYLNNQIVFLQESIEKYLNEVVKNYDILEYSGDKLNIILVYAETNNKIFKYCYRMAIFTKMSSTPIYFDGNMLCTKSYTLEDVRKKAEGFFKTYLKSITNCNI